MKAPKFDESRGDRRLGILRQWSEKMEGKTVKKVSCGQRERYKNAHESDVLRIEFTDGSTLYIETATNTGNIIQKVRDGEGGSLTPPDFHADLHLTWESDTD